MTKLDEKFSERVACRERLLELRKQLAAKYDEATKLRTEATELERSIARETERFVDLDTQVGQLMHADVASVVPKSRTERVKYVGPDGEVTHAVVPELGGAT